jgi:hypothetical protein
MDPFAESPKSVRVTLSADEMIVRRFAQYALFYHLALIPILLGGGNWLLRIADRFGGLFDMPRITVSTNDFWMAPIIGVLVMLSVSCFRVWRKPRRTEWLQPLILIHGVSACSFLAFYFLDVRSMAYLLATLLEGASFAVTFYFVWTYRDLTPQKASVKVAADIPTNIPE